MAKQSKGKPQAKSKAPEKKAAAPKVTVAPAKVEAKAKPAAAPAPKKEKPAGAHAIGPADFVVTRKMSGKTLEGKVGAHVRVELPESTLRGLAWQLHKLPHGVELSGANVEALTPPEGFNNQHRVFDFSVTEAGEYTLQFTLQRPIGQQGVADTFKVRVQAHD